MVCYPQTADEKKKIEEETETEEKKASNEKETEKPDGGDQ